MLMYKIAKSPLGLKSLFLTLFVCVLKIIVVRVRALLILTLLFLFKLLFIGYKPV